MRKCKVHCSVIYLTLFLLYIDIAALCLQNLRKTFIYGGRKNVPLREELSAIAVSRFCSLDWIKFYQNDATQCCRKESFVFLSIAFNMKLIRLVFWWNQTGHFIVKCCNPMMSWYLMTLIWYMQWAIINCSVHNNFKTMFCFVTVV